MNRSLVKKLLFIIGISFVGIFIAWSNLIDGDVSKQISNISISSKKDIFPIKKMKRVNIFDQSEFFTNKLNSLIENKVKNEKSNWSINSNQLSNSLRPLIREELKKVFFKKGWNFEELSGRLYYDVKNTSLELMIIWKKSLYEKEFSCYDRFELIFDVFRL